MAVASSIPPENTRKSKIKCFKSILKILHSNYLQFCSNLPVKFAIFLKSNLLFKFLLSFPFINKTLGINILKTGRVMNAKISVFVICVKAMIFLLYNSRHCTSNRLNNITAAVLVFKGRFKHVPSKWLAVKKIILSFQFWVCNILLCLHNSIS